MDADETNPAERSAERPAVVERPSDAPQNAAATDPGALRRRIVHYLPSIRLAEGGVTRAVLDLCSVIASRESFDVTLLTCDASDAPPEWKAGEGQRLPRVVELPRLGAFGLLTGAALNVARPIIQSASALHLHAPWLTSNVQLAKLADRANVPYVLTIHGMLDDWSMAQRRWKKKLYLAFRGNRLMGRAARIHLTAGGELEQAGKWFDQSKAIILPLVFDVAPYRELPGSDIARRKYLDGQPSGRPTLLFLSRVHPKKGIELLLDAMALLRNRGRACDLLIAGTGDDEYIRGLRYLCSQRGLEGSVKFLGLVTGVEKVSLYQLADVFVLPTSQENFGLVLPEAMACGTPVVTTKGVDIWPELEAAGASILTLRTANAIAEAVDKLLIDKEVMKSKGERGRAWVMNELNPDRVAERYEAMYREA